jgi:hypothetical protein
MKKVCLVKGGNFVLGIEACYILSRQNEMLAPETAVKEGNIFHLGSLLNRRHCDRPEPGSVFLHLEKEGNKFFLLVDQVIDEIELSEHTTRLPSPSPELAQALFPQVAVSMNLVVLLLDPGQVIPVARQLGQGIGLLAIKHCVQMKTPQEHPSETRTEKRKIQRHNKRPESVNEETFKRVMAWTISQFKQGNVSTEQLGADKLPPGLVQQDGLSDTVIQYLIDQISLRCQESITPSQPGERHGG